MRGPSTLLALAWALVACGSRSSLDVVAPADVQLPDATSPRDAAAPRDAGSPSDAPARHDAPSAPDAACPASSSTPTTFATLPVKPDAIPGYDAIAITRGILYVGEGPPDGPSGTIFSIPIAGGTASPIVTTTYVSGPLVTDGAYLYFLEGVASGSGTNWEYSYPDVRALNLDSGEVMTLANPSPNAIETIYVNASPGVFWSTEETVMDSAPTFAHWSPATMNVSNVVQGEIGVVIDDTNAYWPGGSPGGAVSIFTVGLAGGIPTRLASLPAGSELPELLTADATSIYLRPTDGDPSVAKMPKAGGNVTPVIANAPALAGVFVDSGFFYWIDEDAPGEIARVSVDGGAKEVLVSDPTRNVYAVTTDACSIYYVVDNPSEVRVRAK